jgi:hypothetical protein
MILLDEKLRHKGILYEPFSTASIRASKDGRRRFGRLIDLCFHVVRLTRKDGRLVSEQTIIEAIKDWKGL